MTTLYEISQQREQEEQRPYDPLTDGAMAALQRAADKARKRDIALTGYAVGYRDGRVVYDTEP